jgi:hypothetical protein
MYVVWKLVSLRLEIVFVSSKIGAWFTLNIPLLANYFGRNRWYSNVTWVKWKLVSAHSEIVLISTQDRYMVLPNVP